MPSQQDEKTRNQLVSVISGDALILNVAVLSGLLPFVLVLTVQIFFTWDHQQPTLSDYVYTAAQPFFYGIVFTLGVVLLFYQGYPKNQGPIPLSDNQLASLAGLGAMILAVFPTNHCEAVGAEAYNLYRDNFWGTVHLGGAVLAYLPMALFLLFYFTQTGGTPFRELASGKRIRNIIYILCGTMVMGALIVLMAMWLYRQWNGEGDCFVANQFSYIFWGELVMQIGIAVGWGTKFAGRKMHD